MIHATRRKERRRNGEKKERRKPHRPTKILILGTNKKETTTLTPIISHDDSGGAAWYPHRPRNAPPLNPRFWNSLPLINPPRGGIGGLGWYPLPQLRGVSESCSSVLVAGAGLRAVLLGCEVLGAGPCPFTCAPPRPRLGFVMMCTGPEFGPKLLSLHQTLLELCDLNDKPRVRSGAPTAGLRSLTSWA